MKKYCKFGVSDWTLIFQDGEKYLLNTIQKENISCTSGGSILIELRDTLINPQLFNRLKINYDYPIKVIQSFSGRLNQNNEEKIDIEHGNLNIILEMQGEIGEVSHCNITMVTND